MSFQPFLSFGARRAAAGIGGNDANTKLLLHFDGTDASTTFTDSSSTAHTVTAVGNAQIDTAQSVFGGASGLFDNAGDYLTIPANAAWNLTGIDCTIDFRVRFNSLASVDTVIAGGTAGHWFVYAYSDGRIGCGLQGTNEIMAAAGSVTTGVWYHIAIVRVNSTGRTDIYKDGVSLTNSTTNWTSNASANTIYVGGLGASNYLDGWIDELRVSHTARWTSGFTPPTGAYD